MSSKKTGMSSAEVNSTYGGCATPPPVKIPMKEMKRQQKLENRASLKNFVRTDSVLLLPGGKRIMNNVQICNKNLVQTKKSTPAALPRGFIGSEAGNQIQKMSLSPSIPIGDMNFIQQMVTYANNRRFLDSRNEGSQSCLNQNVKVTSLSSQPPKVLVPQAMIGKTLSHVSYQQYLEKFGHMSATKSIPSTPEQQNQHQTDSQFNENIPIYDSVDGKLAVANGGAETSEPCTLNLSSAGNQNFVPISDLMNKNDQSNMKVVTQNFEASETGDYDDKRDDDEGLVHSDTVLTHNDAEVIDQVLESNNFSSSIIEDAESPQLDTEPLEKNRDELPESDTQKVQKTVAPVKMEKAIAPHKNKNCCLMCRQENRLVMKKVEANNQLLNEILNILKNQNPGENNEVLQEPTCEDTSLPVETYEDLVTLSNKIRDDKAFRLSLLPHLKDQRVMGDYKKSVRQMISALVTDQLAKKRVWVQSGKNKKPTVSKLYIMKYLTQVAKIALPKEKPATSDVLEVLKEWFQRASDRLRGSKAQAKQKEESEPENETLDENAFSHDSEAEDSE